MKPTPDQLASRSQLSRFVRAMQPIVEAVRNTKNALFGRPDDELKGWIERGRWIAEIEDSMGFRLITSTLDKEIEWSRDQLEREESIETRTYLKALRFVKSFILTTRRDSDISMKVLAARAGAIPEDSRMFVRNARVEGN